MAASKTFRLVIPKVSEASFEIEQYSQNVEWNGLSWRLQVQKEEVDETLHLYLMLYYARNKHESSGLVTRNFTWACKLLPCIPMFNVLCRRRRHYIDEDDGEDDWVFASNVTFQFTMNSEVGYIAEDNMKVDLSLEASTISRKWTHEELHYEEVWEEASNKSGSIEEGNDDNIADNDDNATDNDGAGTGDNEKETDNAGGDDKRDEVEMEIEKNCEDKEDRDAAVSTGTRSKHKSDGDSSDDPLEKEIDATVEKSVLLTKEHMQNYSDNNILQELKTTHEKLVKEQTRLMQEVASLRNSLHRLKMNRDTAVIEAGYLAQSLVCVPMCYVCGTKPVNKMLVPCRHMSVCAPCSLIVSFCPRCKYPIMNAVTPSSCILSEHFHSTA